MTSRLKTLIAIACLWSLAGIGCATAQPIPVDDGRTGVSKETPAVDPTVQADVARLFRGHEYQPTRDDFLRATSGDEALAIAALTALHNDPDARTHVRTNALVSLRFFPNDDTRRFFETTIDADDTDKVTRRSAIMAYGQAFGDDAVPLIASRGLNNDDLHTRTAATRALRLIASPNARDAVSTRLAVEPLESVRDTLQEALKDWPE